MATSTRRTFITILCAENPGVLVTEHLRYLGAIRIFSDAHPGALPNEIKQFFFAWRTSDTLVTIECPDKASGPQAQWGTMQMARLHSFGVAAVLWTTVAHQSRVLQHTHALGVLFNERRMEDLLTAAHREGKHDDGHRHDCPDCEAIVRTIRSAELVVDEEVTPNPFANIGFNPDPRHPAFFTIEEEENK